MLMLHPEILMQEVSGKWLTKWYVQNKFGKDFSQSWWERWKTGSRDNWRVGGETNPKLDGCVLGLLLKYFSFVLCVQYFLELRESEAAYRLFWKQHLSNEDEALG